MTCAELSTQVAVIGGGPAGLALALDLAQRNVHVTIVDRGLEPLPGVRAGGISHQMMEHMRRLGVAGELRALAPLPSDWPRSAVVTARLAEPELVVLAPRLNPQQSAHLTAEPPQNAPSALLERILRRRLADLPHARCLFGYEFDGTLDNADNGVALTVRDSVGAPTRISARYAVGCDGAHSLVRKTLGIGVDGKPAFATRWKMQFTSSSFREVIGKGRHNQYWVINRDMVAYFLQRDAVSEWTLHIQEASESFQSSFGDPAEVLQQIVGKPVPLEWTETPQRWRANAIWAERLRDRSVFLAGDSAHAMPPGGFGLHLGNGDAANLAWKLQAVLHGWAGAALLDSYHAERFPLARRYAQAVETGPHPVRRAVLAEPAYETDGNEAAAARARVAQVAVETRAERQNRMIESIYDTVESDVLTPVGDVGRDLVVVGRRLPHRWFAPTISIYDQLGGPLALIIEPDRQEAAFALKAVADAWAVPLLIVEVPAGTYEQPLVLVRPDRIVAWTGGELSDPDAILATVLGLSGELSSRRMIGAVG